jgi:anti-sigma regulatory factor (Ser/Thr protein kinase)
MGEHITTSPPRTRSGVFPARPEQVREARKLISAALEGCPAADDAILCISELAANSCLHSASGNAGGTVTIRAEIHEGDYVWIEVEDNGGPWDQHIRPDSRPHGLGIVRALAADSGTDGDPRRTAARIAWHSPQWVVLWGTHTRLYWGFPRFQAPPGTMIAAPDTAALIIRMRHTRHQRRRRRRDPDRAAWRVRRPLADQQNPARLHRATPAPARAPAHPHRRDRARAAATPPARIRHQHPRRDRGRLRRPVGDRAP